MRSAPTAAQPTRQPTNQPTNHPTTLAPRAFCGSTGLDRQVQHSRASRPEAGSSILGCSEYTGQGGRGEADAWGGAMGSAAAASSHTVAAAPPYRQLLS